MQRNFSMQNLSWKWHDVNIVNALSVSKVAIVFVSVEVVFETAKEFLPIQVKPQQTVEIVCDVPDETTPATWYHDEVKLVHDGVKYEMDTKETKRTLVVHDVKPEDEGQYVCEVGPHRTTATLQVLKPEEKEIKGSLACFGCWFWNVHVLLEIILLPL